MAAVKNPKPNPASIQIHFDGSIVNDHRVSIRTLGKTLGHLQNAVDRAYLDLRYGNVMKYQRLKKEEYSDTDFIALNPEEGGFILEMISETGKKISDRLAIAVGIAYEKDIGRADVEHQRILEQAEMRAKVYKASGEAKNFKAFVATNEGDLARAFGDRSIVKEIDQVLSLIRTERYADSTFELSLYGTRAHPIYKFDAERASRFHDVVSQRRLGKPLLMTVELRSLDAGRQGQISHGKAKNIDTGKEFHFIVPDAVIFDRLARNLKRRKRDALAVVSCPIYEYDSFDPMGGDVVIIAFQGVVNE